MFIFSAMGAADWLKSENWKTNYGAVQENAISTIFPVNVG